MLYVNYVISEFSSDRERIVRMVTRCAYITSNSLDIAGAATIGPLLITRRSTWTDHVFSQDTYSYMQETYSKRFIFCFSF